MSDDEDPYIRMDFDTQIVSMDEKTRIVRFMSVPHPDRYDSREVDGRTVWRDKFLGYEFGVEVLEQIAKDALGSPGHYAPPTIDNLQDYAAERFTAISTELSGGAYSAPSQKADAHHSLPEENENAEMTFVSVDIVGSTPTRAKYGRKYDQVLQLFFREMGTLAGQFHGTIFKITGDGALFYFNIPTVNLQCDNAVSFGLAVLSLLRAVNRALLIDLPKLKVRIGAEYGSVRITRFDVPATGYSALDVIGDGLNRAVKIQSKAPPNKLVIGRALYERVHVTWLKRAQQRNLHLDKALGCPGYKTYVIHEDDTAPTAESSPIRISGVDPRPKFPISFINSTRR